jgi:capsular polysaccharide transport system permease protein
VNSRTTTVLMDTALSPIQMLKAQWRVIVALMLHDVSSRFAGSRLGYFAMGVGFPLSHIMILLLIYSGLGRAAPYGDSPALWFATGVVPFMAFQYMSRFISLGVAINKSLLWFPVVKIADIIFSRTIIELLNAGMVVLILAVVFQVAGIDIMPLDVVQASLAMLAMMLLGIGFGVINAVLCSIFPFWVTGYALIAMIFWIASGIVFVPDALPDVARYPISFFPPLQGVEWMRSAYYEGYGSNVLDKTYLVSVGVGSLFLGLVLERLLRGKMIR